MIDDDDNDDDDDDTMMIMMMITNNADDGEGDDGIDNEGGDEFGHGSRPRSRSMQLRSTMFHVRKTLKYPEI